MTKKHLSKKVKKTNKNRKVNRKSNRTVKKQRGGNTKKADFGLRRGRFLPGYNSSFTFAPNHNELSTYNPTENNEIQGMLYRTNKFNKAPNSSPQKRYGYEFRPNNNHHNGNFGFPDN